MSTVACSKETGICPFAVPFSRSDFDEVVRRMREAVRSLYTEQREAFIDTEFGSTQAERAQQSELQTEADNAHLSRFHPKFGHPDPFAAPWLPPQCKVTVPRFPHDELLLARRGVEALPSSEGVHLRKFIDAGHRLLAIPYEELVAIPFMDAWLFKYALTRFFDFPDAAQRFLNFREVVLEHHLGFVLTDEIRRCLATGAFNPLPQHAESVSLSRLLDSSAEADFGTDRDADPRHTDMDSASQSSASTVSAAISKHGSTWHHRTPVTLLRPRRFNWEELTTEAVSRSFFYYNMNVVGLDWLAQVQGIVLQNSIKAAGISNLNRQFARFAANTLQRCMPVKMARGFIANDGFFVHHVVYPMMKLLLSSKLQSKLILLGKDYTPLLEELGPERAMEECGGKIVLKDDGSLALTLVEALCIEREPRTPTNQTPHH